MQSNAEFTFCVCASEKVSFPTFKLLKNGITKT
jgi:hypothetical protein